MKSNTVKLSPYERAINRLNDLPLALDKIFSEALEDLRRQRDEARAQLEAQGTGMMVLDMILGRPKDGLLEAVKRLQAERDAARREGAEAMRAAAAQVVKHLSNEDGLGMGSLRIEGAIRTLPLPGEEKP